MNGPELAVDQEHATAESGGEQRAGESEGRARTRHQKRTEKPSLGETRPVVAAVEASWTGVDR